MDPKHVAAYGDQDGEAIKKAKVLKSIRETFDIFDKEGTGQVDSREIGTLIRALGVFPQESDLENLVDQCQEEPPTGFVTFKKFNVMMCAAAVTLTFVNQQGSRPALLLDVLSLMKHEYADTLLRAFRVLDTEGTGFIEAEKMRTLLALKCDKFSQEEIDEFIAFAADPATGTIIYDEYVAQVCPF